ncbi:MAG: CapA family protein [Candidatus Omnitrophota bacterium]
MKDNNKKSISLIITGDIMLGGTLSAGLKKYNYSHLRDCFQDADIVFGNLEAPFSNQGQPQENKILLSQPPEAVELIDYLGFNVLSLGNNHIMDYGEKGLDETLRILSENNIQYIGAGNDLAQARKPAEFSMCGIKVSILGYASQSTEKSNPLVYARENKKGLAEFNMEVIKEDIKRAKAQGTDIVVVSLHWGEEMYHFPYPEQRKQAHEIIDMGANIIAGHHPHLLQGVEKYKNGVILYSLGNFIFGEFIMPNDKWYRWSPRNRLSAYLEFTVGKQGILSYNVVPLWIGKELIPSQAKKISCRRAIERFSKILSSPDYERLFKGIKAKENQAIFWDKVKRRFLGYGL